MAGEVSVDEDMDAGSAPGLAGAERAAEVLDRRLIQFVGGVEDREVIAALVAWSSIMLEAFAVYASSANALVATYRGRSLSVADLSRIMMFWRDSLERLVHAVITRSSELALSSAKNSRAAKARLACGGPLPGDVRTRFGEAQVWVDGCWRVLGVRRAP